MPFSRPYPACRSALVSTGFILLAGCAAVPDLGPKPVPVRPDMVASSRSLPAGTAAWPGGDWWKSYGDPQLDRLIEEGLDGSPDVAAAAARFQRAQGMAQQVGAAQLPRVDANGSVTEDRQSLNNGFPDNFKAFLPQGWNDHGMASVSLNFDIDLWGKNRAALAAATSESRAARIDMAQARLMIATGVANAYADLQRLYAVRDIAQGAFDIRFATAKLVSDRVRSGLDTRGEQSQADAGVLSARADLAAADEAIALRCNQIAALVGAGPDRGRDIVRPALPALGARGLPPGVTTDLVGRRPDVAAALARADAAASRIKVARADFFPAISLSALIGVQSLGLELLDKTDSIYSSAGPAISLPIFHGGALAGQYKGARATL
jgi:NodT family efflux transporter outer membrane factor (OMF) lipoprotein